jgi:formylglycine-generating enzyme required for sulfatase activity
VVLRVALSWVALSLAFPSGLRAQVGSAAPAAAPRPAFLSDFWNLPSGDLLGFVEIPAGPFLMGSERERDPQALDNELWADGGPVTVEVPTYYIGRYEVTVAQFARFVEETGYSVGSPAALQAPPDFPVANVSWTDALAYARWVERILRASPRTPEPIRAILADGWRVTLPSEAEWEKAARGEDGRIYPWGDAPRPDRARYRASSPAPVGAYECPECPYGLRDLAGNVWEWTRTPFVLAPYSRESRELDIMADALWTMRGGSYGDAENMIRSAVRGGADPGARRPFLGFRLALVHSREVTRNP